METGEATALTTSQRAEIQRIVQRAREICGYEFGVFVGPLDSGRESAIAMHAGMSDPNSAVLLAIDPMHRTMDVVTGGRLKRNLEDRTCEFALLTLRSSLQVDDLTGGIRDSIMLLAEHARAPRTLHLDEPA
jgi:hypothetical protein